MQTRKFQWAQFEKREAGQMRRHAVAGAMKSISKRAGSGSCSKWANKNKEILFRTKALHTGIGGRLQTE
eukprot:576689-Pleurochrysis_carterae.AAC.2